MLNLFQHVKIQSIFEQLFYKTYRLIALIYLGKRENLNNVEAKLIFTAHNYCQGTAQTINYELKVAAKKSLVHLFERERKNTMRIQCFEGVASIFTTRSYI